MKKEQVPKKNFFEKSSIQKKKLQKTSQRGVHSVRQTDAISTNFALTFLSPQKKHFSHPIGPHRKFCPALPKLIFILSSFYILWAYFKPEMNNVEACRDKCGQFLYEKGEKNTVFEKINFFLQNCFSLIFLYDHPEDDPVLLKN